MYIQYTHFVFFFKNVSFISNCIYIAVTIVHSENKTQSYLWGFPLKKEPFTNYLYIVRSKICHSKPRERIKRGLTMRSARSQMVETARTSDSVPIWLLLLPLLPLSVFAQLQHWLRSDRIWLVELIIVDQSIHRLQVILLISRISPASVENRPRAVIYIFQKASF